MGEGNLMATQEEDYVARACLSLSKVQMGKVLREQKKTFGLFLSFFSFFLFWEKGSTYGQSCCLFCSSSHFFFKNIVQQSQVITHTTKTDLIHLYCVCPFRSVLTPGDHLETYLWSFLDMFSGSKTCLRMQKISPQTVYVIYPLVT